MIKVSNYSNNLLVEWNYSGREWNEFVTQEKSIKKEENIYFGIGILVLGSLTLIFLLKTSVLNGLLFTFPLALLIPFLRYKFSFPHLKKLVKKPTVKIFIDHLEINNHTIDLSGKRRELKNLKIITAKNDKQFLEFEIQWITAKGNNNDKFRILIPTDKLEEAKNLTTNF